MKKFMLLLCMEVIILAGIHAQITTPVIRANFGIDADLRSNYFNGLVQTGNDDFFKLPGTFGSGEFMIDTTGASALLAQYAAIPSSRSLPFYKSMRFPPYQVVNNRLLIDGYFARDYHGNDSTMFAAGSNKNGMHPNDWSCPVSQPIPDKNEILDIMLHARRAGPNVADSLWMIGGISIENTTGNRYFDFEMYQTDLYYDRTLRKFFNYGPDAGHTRWQFNSMGDMTAPGDIVFTAEYSSSSLTLLEARIWVHKNELLSTPTAFNWTGSFDGATASSVYGYAGILPKSAGAFYTGLQSNNNTWGGVFAIVLGNNAIVNDYIARQYMEFSVNLTKLGLDQDGVMGDNDCATPFRKVLVKTRSSISFTAELKDFVSPFHFFVAPKAELETTTPVICDEGSISNIFIVNPISTSRYSWSTIGGNIVGPTNGTSINVDTPGIYIVQQFLNDSCPLFATDTILISSLGPCFILQNNFLQFNSKLFDQGVNLSWSVAENLYIKGFFVEKSYDGSSFQAIRYFAADTLVPGFMQYNFFDSITDKQHLVVYYRIKLIPANNQLFYSKIVQHFLYQDKKLIVSVHPNPVKDKINLAVQVPENVTGLLFINDDKGNRILMEKLFLQKGNNVRIIDPPTNAKSGTYFITIRTIEGNKTIKLFFDK